MYGSDIVPFHGLSGLLVLVVGLLGESSRASSWRA